MTEKRTKEHALLYGGKHIGDFARGTDDRERMEEMFSFRVSSLSVFLSESRCTKSLGSL